MKKILTILITGALAVSAFGQGAIQFKTGNSDLIGFSNDGVTFSPITGPQGGVGSAGALGPVTIEVWSAPVGTSLAGDDTSESLVVALTRQGSPWALGTFAVPPQLIGPGTYGGDTVTLGNGVAGANQEIEIIDFTGPSLAEADSFAFSGEIFNGKQLGALGWTQGTGNPNGIPPTVPTSIATGSGAFQGLVFVPIPEPGTIALTSFGAISLLAFRRRK